jgi:iron complex outermembrane receptor protein
VKSNKQSNLHLCRIIFGTLIVHLSILALVIPTLANADNINSASRADAPETDDELFFDMPVVLSASRLEQPVSEAAVSVTVIDRKTIEASGARTIPEALRLVPGMQVGYSGNIFGDEPKYVVSYHGHSDQYSRQMQVLIDGRSIYNPFFGGINWKAIPVNIDDIERIEVSRGPNIASYGANAFMAAINIITRTAAEDQGSYVRTNLGNHDIADLTYRFGGASGDLDYRVTASTLNDDGLDSANQTDFTDDTNSNNIDYRVDYQLDDNNSISYQGGYGLNKQQTDRNYLQVLPTSRTVDNTQFFQFIKWEKSLASDDSFLLQYYYNLYDKEDRYKSDLVDPGNGLDPFQLDVDGDIKSERHNLEFTYFMNHTEDLQVVLGVSSQFDSVQSKLFFDTDDRLTNEQYRVFANFEYKINQSNSVDFGALWEKSSFSEAGLSPRISLTHIFNTQHRVRIGISQAKRAPFIFEALASQTFYQELTVGGSPSGLTLRENVVGSTAYRSEDLKNEKILSREIVYLGNYFNSTLMFNARLFHDSVTDYLDTKNVEDTVFEQGQILFDEDVDIYINELNSTTTGLELELDYYIDPSLRLIASGAIINISGNSEKLSLSAPQHSYSLLLSKRFNEKYNASVAYYYSEAFKWTDAFGDTHPEENGTSTDKYTTLDFRLTRNFYFAKTNGSLSVVVKNLLDDYSDYQKNSFNNPPTIVNDSPIAINNTLAYVDFRLNF